MLPTITGSFDPNGIPGKHLKGHTYCTNTVHFTEVCPLAHYVG